MNTKQLETVLESLRSKLTDVTAWTDGEFIEMASETSDVDSQMMFGYFEGSLDHDEVQAIEGHASRQFVGKQLFLETLIGIGELVLESRLKEQAHAERPKEVK